MNKSLIKGIVKYFLKITALPVIFLTFGYLGNYFLFLLGDKYQLNSITEVDISFYFINIIQVISIYWIVFNAIKILAKNIFDWATLRNYSVLLIVIPLILSSLEGILLLTMINVLTYTLQLNGTLGLFVDKSSKVLLILTLSWIFYKIIFSFEQYINNKYIIVNENINVSRKLKTQIVLLKKVILFFVGIITVACIIMVFDSTRSVGISLLTTAGIVSAIGAFASQQSLGRIFAGLQLAFTQPVRIGDTVVIDDEFGHIEAISLSFITIKLWDLRHLILPTDVFIQKGVLNLTHDSSELLGTVFLYADYTLPIDDIRRKFIELTHASEFWNKKIAKLEITEMKERAMEIRCLLSADNASNLWQLRCEIRENLIKYIVKCHKDCLTLSRNITVPLEESAVS